jgi:hypothetical protein
MKNPIYTYDVTYSVSDELKSSDMTLVKEVAMNLRYCLLL